MSTTPPVGKAQPSDVSPPSIITMTFSDKRLWIVSGLLLAVAVVAQTIGEVNIPLGGTVAITLLPMIWAILIGGFVSGNPWKPMPKQLQEAAGTLMSVAVLLFGARLSFNIGPQIPTLFDAGAALLLQEVGHLFGTLFLALPLAVALRMGPATIGATFSIDREASFAMVQDRYGQQSPQYQGVLSMYVFGTIFGAIIISLVTSVTMGFGIFHPLALAMGSGVGSGSMMGAAAAVISNGHPELTDEVMAFAATSNLITTVLGLYVGIWVALPMADWMYRKLTRQKDIALTKSDFAQASKTAETTGEGDAAQKAKQVLSSGVKIPLWVTLSILFVIGTVVAIVAHVTSPPVDHVTGQEIPLNVMQMMFGWAILIALTVFSIYGAKWTKGIVPGIAIVITVGAYFSSQWFPWADVINGAVGSLNQMGIITMLLAVAGLSLGKDLPMLKGIGWKIIPVGIVAIAASFLMAVVIAEFALGLWHP
ncbi:MAG: DUF3100 domain-containing protein [Ancrocorticia sp.]